MYMNMSSARPNRVEVVSSVQRRRRWTPELKLARHARFWLVAVSARPSCRQAKQHALVFRWVGTVL
jgi:hypothetical protein